LSVGRARASAGRRALALASSPLRVAPSGGKPGTGTRVRSPSIFLHGSRFARSLLAAGLGLALLTGCGADAASSHGSPSAQGVTLPEKYADYFPIGAAINGWYLDNLEGVVASQLNHLTCDNAMKIEVIHPEPDRYDFTEADRIADYARAHGMKLTGHTLLWHRQAPDWMFDGITAGDADSLELLKSRLKDHITTVVGRYADVVDNWDVVNEAISSYSNRVYRDGSEGSRWYEAFGSEEYIYWAYQYAYEALEALEPGSSAGKLYYNDYSTIAKADKIMQMLSWLEQKGIHVDGVGFQSHDSLTYPSPSELQGAFDQFVNAGYKLKISELDLTVYSDYATGSFVASPQVELTPELEAKQAQRYAALFAVYRQNRDAITSVTFWGLSDDQSWLNYEPVFGRNDYPLLYNRDHQPKAALDAILDF